MKSDLSFIENKHSVVMCLANELTYARYVRGHSRWSMSHCKTSRMRCKNKFLHLLVDSADDNTVISFVKSKFLMYICG